MLAGGAHVTVSCRWPGASAGAPGAPGGVPGVAVAEGDQPPSPRAFPARTCTSYAVPFVSPVIVWLVAVVARSIVKVRERLLKFWLTLDVYQK